MSEKSVTAKKHFNIKRIIAVIVIFVLIAAMIFSSPEVRNSLFGPDNIKLSFQSGIKYDAVPYNKGMLIIGGDTIRAIDSRGRENWNIVSPINSPMVITKNKYVMLADLDGTTVSVYEKDKLISQIKTEREILTAKVNKNGYVAVATGEMGYKGAVRVYDRKGTEIYKWLSGSGYIGDIDISSQNKLAVAQLMTDKEQIYTRILTFETDSEKEPGNIAQINGIVMKLKYKSNGGIVAVCDSGVYGFKKNGTQDYFIDFGGRTPVECNIENDNNMVFTFDSGLNNAILESYSSKGKLRGSYETNGEMTSFDVNGERIMVATINGIYRITPKGKEKSHTVNPYDVNLVKIFPGRRQFLSIGSGTAEIIRVK